jgi:hypothetical protein
MQEDGNSPADSDRAADATGRSGCVWRRWPVAAPTVLSYLDLTWSTAIGLTPPVLTRHRHIRFRPSLRSRERPDCRAPWRPARCDGALCNSAVARTSTLRCGARQANMIHNASTPFLPSAGPSVLRLDNGYPNLDPGTSDAARPCLVVPWRLPAAVASADGRAATRRVGPVLLGGFEVMLIS